MGAPADKPDYKDTLHLPQTSFPMKADLAKREPEWLARWESEGLYRQILAARKNARRWVFHDGPPYANGHLHFGHVLNKTLKDIVVKSRTMMGYYVEYKPGWDCHGLPIELAVMRELGERVQKLSAVEIRKACHDYAMRWVTTQRDEFKRLGVFGTWDAPYLTLDASYEATIVRQLAEFARQGLLYREKKSVHWCMSCKTALAEAEIEYDEAHRSPSIYVKFALPEPGLYAVIWTTTPWTLPANHAIAYNPEFAYVVVTVGDERYVVADKLADSFLHACGFKASARVPFPVAELAAMGGARHPFIDRVSRLVPADYVTLEQGTGLVHTAPGHGADDYLTGKKFGLPIDAPVDDAGRFVSDFGPLALQGVNVRKANPTIVAHLHETRALLSPPTAEVVHSYPICWRCKNPVIFRATWQWFASLDRQICRNCCMDEGKHAANKKCLFAETHFESAGSLRRVALDEIGRTQWIPPWGENRILGMIANRPDWVLSRQRLWGVPIPVFYDEDAGPEAAPICDHRVMSHVADIVAREGASAWFARPAHELVPGDVPELKGRRLRKGEDIVDVWFESGVSWAAVCEGRPELDASNDKDPRPIDLYLEGSDQHRGWFHSSLLTAAATRRHAPYRAVLTHGFVLDERGRPYSKSEIEKARREGLKIEYIPPEEVIKTQGAELLRLWSASADFRNDVAFSRSHLNQLGEFYRKVRNTARFLLGNLAGFDPAIASEYRAGVGFEGLERYLYAQIRRVNERVLKAYQDYEFHVVMRVLGDLCTTDLSALFLDVRKDRLYCDPQGSTQRLATQAILYLAARHLALLSAPILCFTAEEIWSHLPHRPEDPASVHLGTFEPMAALPDEPEVVDMWTRLLEWRRIVQTRLEPFRAAKHSSLDAHVILVTPDPKALRLTPTDLADLFIVSEVEVRQGEADDVVVTEAQGYKCERCWKVTTRSPLCTRCLAALPAPGTTP
ncbi:MAG TPA: isoleucine--tRNA ligase [Polyangia bacterium]|nr:isoleucine--tRNA ligase [Polyangia bacterium]